MVAKVCSNLRNCQNIQVFCTTFPLVLNNVNLYPMMYSSPKEHQPLKQKKILPNVAKNPPKAAAQCEKPSSMMT